jgi:aryl-alcohol dehydrogenase-like predicted oxidoreductase
MKPTGTSRRELILSLPGLAALASLSRRQDGRPAEAGPRSVPLERRRFGKTDMEVGVLGFGSAEIGYERIEQPIVDRLLGTALDGGLNVIDTAECYVEAEAQIGNAVAHRRKDYHLFTKCGHLAPDGSYGDGWSKTAILRSLERSLERLRTDAVDLLQLHSCSREVLARGECIEALEQAKKDGKTRYIGYSGDSEDALFAVESGKFDALQISINLCDQEALDLVLPKARERDMGVIAKRPIANAVWRNESEPESDYHQVYWRRLQALAYPFASGDARSREEADGPAGVAMRFTAMQPGVHVLIVGTTRPERWRQNAELLAAGPLPSELERSIRDRWKAVAEADWTGQT